MVLLQLQLFLAINSWKTAESRSSKQEKQLQGLRTAQGYTFAGLKVLEVVAWRSEAARTYKDPLVRTATRFISSRSTLLSTHIRLCGLDISLTSGWILRASIVCHANFRETSCSGDQRQAMVVRRSHAHTYRCNGLTKLCLQVFRVLPAKVWPSQTWPAESPLIVILQDCRRCTKPLCTY